MLSNGENVTLDEVKEMLNECDLHHNGNPKYLFSPPPTPPPPPRMDADPQSALDAFLASNGVSIPRASGLSTSRTFGRRWALRSPKNSSRIHNSLRFDVRGLDVWTKRRGVERS